MKLHFNYLKRALITLLVLGILSCDSESKEDMTEFNCIPGDLNFIDVQAEQELEGIDQTMGGRTKNFYETKSGCGKFIDGSDGTFTKIKYKERYEGKC